MILYFSATGTSKYVAEQIAKATNDKIVPLKELVRQETYSIAVPEGENFGVVMPTYWEGLPAILLDYLQKVEINLEGAAITAILWLLMDATMVIFYPRRKGDSARWEFSLTACMRLVLSIIGVPCST